MSMSEFDTQMNREDDDPISCLLRKEAIPPDFSEEDLAFAQELNTLFSAEQEELPPLFVQTLLQAEDPRFRPAEHGFEKKTSARVFRRLHLRRRLFTAPRSAKEVISSSIHGIVVNRSLLAFACVLMLVMLFTVAFTAPSFTSGMALLLQGSHSGVYQVEHYPTGVHRHHGTYDFDAREWPQQISLSQAIQRLSFPMYWPQMIPRDYSLTAVLLEDTGQQWANGPILDLVYTLNGQKPDANNQIIVREFLPNEDVLQLVQEGAAHPVEIDQYGEAKAIYVDGQWALQDGQSLPQWAYGGRSELIYQQNNVVFWIVGNQQMGVNEKMLLTIAQSLQIFHIGHQMHMLSDSRDAAGVTVIDWAPDQFLTDVVVVFQGENGNSPSYIPVSSYQLVKTAQKIVATGH
ncbi:MAG TPA: hypothetical protein VFA09_23015 [Ktedonobacteraceae bacterium]|nr:hypothetical protein [Ktedonobacteraceae bacterium]